MNILRRIALGTVALTAMAANAQTLFPYPTVPESIEGLTPRSDYMMEHFWDRCDLKSVFSSVKKFQGAFSDYVDLMPFASGEVMKHSVESFLKEVGKKPKNLLTVAEMAEGLLYSDTAHVRCDECYLPFAQAVASNKKLSKAERARFDYQAKVLSRSQVGMTAPDIAYTTREGKSERLSDIAYGPYILIFINDPSCDECAMARVRLQADYALNSLIDKGLIKVLSLYPGEYDPDWAEQARDYSSRWIVGAAPDADEYFDMRNPPVFYYLNGNHKILSKSLAVDNLIEAFRRVNNRASATGSENVNDQEQ